MIPARLLDQLHDPLVTLGLIVDPAHLTEDDFRDGVIAQQWRNVAHVAFAAHWMFVAAGRPFDEEAGGFYALVPERAHLEMAVLAAHHRMASVGSKATLWLVIADAATQARLTALLADQEATEGTA